MWNFIKHYALEIYTVLSMLLLAYAAMSGELSVIQKLVVIDTLLFVLHEWEEGHYPGGFVDMIASLIQVNVSDEIKRASRVPAGILLLLLSVLPFVFDDVPMIVMALATFGIIEGIVHTVGIRLFRRKNFYTPGMVTAWFEFAVSITLIVCLATNNIGQWYDYLFGPVIMIVCFGILQKTETLLVGINYGDMPKYLKRQWTQK